MQEKYEDQKLFFCIFITFQIQKEKLFLGIYSKINFISTLLQKQLREHLRFCSPTHVISVAQITLIKIKKKKTPKNKYKLE